jgi:hypothetical protein
MSICAISGYEISHPAGNHSHPTPAIFRETDASSVVTGATTPETKKPKQQRSALHMQPWYKHTLSGERKYE